MQAILGTDKNIRDGLREQQSKQHLLPIYIRYIVGLPLGFPSTFLPLWLHICICLSEFISLRKSAELPLASRALTQRRIVS